MSKYGEPWRVSCHSETISVSNYTQAVAVTSIVSSPGYILADWKSINIAPERLTACVNSCAGMEDPEKEIADLREQNASLLRLIAGGGGGWKEIADLQARNASLLRLLEDIRAAAGDPSGRLMQDELVDHIRTMRRDADAYSIESVRMKGDLI